MVTAAQARSARRRLDAKLGEIDAAALAPPRAGWVRAIREALGMSQADLARRLGITTQTVQDLEASERAGKARLDSLRRAADALECDLAYVLVPRRGLDDTVAAQAARVLGAEVAATDRTMALEAQDATVAPHVLSALTEQLIASKRLWRR